MVPIGATAHPVADQQGHTPVCACSPGSAVLCFALRPDEVRRIAALEQPRHVARGQSVYCSGDSAHAFYRVHTGSCKSITHLAEGLMQVTGYHLPDDIVGLDGLAIGTYSDQVIALESCEVRLLHYDKLDRLAHEVPSLRRNIMRLLAMETLRNAESMLLLGRLRSDCRVASFLLDLSRRHAERGNSAVEFTVQLSVTDLGSLLGLKLETICRALSRLQADRVLQREGRRLRLLDLAALQAWAGTAEDRLTTRRQSGRLRGARAA